jgi:hypothetical protein
MRFAVGSPQCRPCAGSPSITAPVGVRSGALGRAWPGRLRSASASSTASRSSRSHPSAVRRRPIGVRAPAQAAPRPPVRQPSAAPGRAPRAATPASVRRPSQSRSSRRLLGPPSRRPPAGALPPRPRRYMHPSSGVPAAERRMEGVGARAEGRVRHAGPVGEVVPRAPTRPREVGHLVVLEPRRGEPLVRQQVLVRVAVLVRDRLLSLPHPSAQRRPGSAVRP